MAEPDNLKSKPVAAFLRKLLSTRIMQNRRHSLVLNHLNKSIMEHNLMRWYKVLKIKIGNRIEWYNIVGTTKEVPIDFKWYDF